MDKFKREYVHPKLLLFTYEGCLENSLVTRDINSATDIVYTTNQNEVPTLTFTIPFTKNRKISYDDCEKLIKYGNEYFIIKSIDVKDDSARDISVSCEHISTSLKGIYCECIKMIGKSPEEIFNAIISAVTPLNINGLYKWAGTDVPSNKKRRLITEDETSVYENLVSMAEVFNGWLDIYTDDNGQKWVYLKTKYDSNNRIIKKSLDMKSLGITYDSTEIFTQVLPYGASDELTGNEIDIISVNPTHKAYLEDYSWYIAKGIPLNVIDSNPMYQQFKILRDDTYIDKNELMEMAKEELAKCCIPKLEATLTMSDLSAYIDSPLETPKVGEEVICVNKDIDFVFKCNIVGVEKHFKNPLETTITISNYVRYDTTFQNIQHTVNNADKVISNSPIDSDGNPTGDGDTYIDASKVKDGDHINVVYRINECNSLITETGNNINLKVEEVGKNVAQIDIKANEITSTVEEVNDEIGNAKSEIRQTARKISAVVEEGEDSGSWELTSKAFEVGFNKATEDIMTVSGDGILVHNNDGSYTRISSKGIENLSSKTSSNGRPYHYLTYTKTMNAIKTNDGDGDYRHVSFKLPSQFDGVADEDIAVTASIAKCNDSNSGSQCLLYWFGVYSSVSDGYVNLDVMACWRHYTTDSNDVSDWVEDFSSPKGGYCDVQVTIVA